MISDEEKQELYTDGFADGVKRGRAEGRAEGRADGRAEGVIEVARQLLSMGATVDYVSKATGLSEQEIQRLVK